MTYSMTYSMTNGVSVSAGKLYGQILAQKERLLVGWIAYVVLCTGNGPPWAVLHAAFGEWMYRTPKLVQRDDSSWFLEA